LGVIVDQSVKGAIYTYIGVALGFATTLLFSKILSPEQIGLTRILVSYSTLIAQFGALGINGVIIRYFPYFRDAAKKHHGFLSLALLAGLIGFILSTLVLLLFKPLLISTSIEKSSMFVEYINWLIVIVFFQIFFTIFDGYYTALYNSIHGTWLKEVFQRILIILIIGAYFFGFVGFHQFVIWYIAAMSVPTLMILYKLIREHHFSLRTEFGFVDKNLLRMMLLMAGFSIFNGLTLVLIQNVDILMINSLVGLEGAGIYFICFNFGLFVNIPARSIYKIANVVAAQAWKNNDMKLIRDIYYKSCLTLFIIGSLLFVGIWANVDNIFQIIGEKFVSGKWVIFFIALGGLIDLTTGVNSSILGSSKHYKVQTLFLVILVFLIVAANLILIPRYGINGAAIGSAVSLTILNIVRFLFLYLKFNLQPFNLKFVYILLIAGAVYFISWMIPPFGNYIVDIIIRSSLIIVLFGLPVYYLKISDDINKKADQYLWLTGLKK
jgi:O-antigen/teichoic acid export membrane protein